MAQRTVLLALTVLFAAGGCRSAYYGFWEKLGREKRDLLRSDVTAVKEQQEKSAEHFKDALERLQEAYGKPGTKLQTVYDKLKADNESAQQEAAALEKRAASMNTTARDLFREWEKETEVFTNPEFRTKSRASLQRARTRFASLSQSVEKSTKRMKPILTRLHETTLFLKHNLNAQSLGAMKQESESIGRSVDALLKQVGASVREADEFLAVLKTDEDA